MQETAIKGKSFMEMKKVSISQKRQITIPQKYFKMLGFDREAECIVRGKELVIRPVKQSGGSEFSEQILADLIEQGLEGAQLLEMFKKTQAKMRHAVEGVISEAECVAAGKGEYCTYEDVFGAEED